MRCIFNYVAAVTLFFNLPSFARADDDLNPSLNHAITIDIFSWSQNVTFRKKVTERDFIFIEANISKIEDTLNFTNDSVCSNSSDIKSLKLNVGDRRYLIRNEVSIFFEVKLTSNYSDASINNCTSSDSINTYKSKGLGLGVSFGGEYFLRKNVSFEGKLNLAASYLKLSGDRTGNRKQIENNTTSLMMNYYF